MRNFHLIALLLFVTDWNDGRYSFSSVITVFFLPLKKKALQTQKDLRKQLQMEKSMVKEQNNEAEMEKLLQKLRTQTTQLGKSPEGAVY